MFDIEFTRLERQSDSYFYWHIWDKDDIEYYISNKYGSVCIAHLDDYNRLDECVEILEPHDRFTPLTTKQMLDCLGAVYEDLPIEFESDI